MEAPFPFPNDPKDEHKVRAVLEAFEELRRECTVDLSEAVRRALDEPETKEQ